MRQSMSCCAFWGVQLFQALSFFSSSIHCCNSEGHCRVVRRNCGNNIKITVLNSGNATFEWRGPWPASRRPRHPRSQDDDCEHAVNLKCCLGIMVCLQLKPQVWIAGAVWGHLGYSSQGVPRTGVTVLVFSWLFILWFRTFENTFCFRLETLVVIWPRTCSWSPVA